MELRGKNVLLGVTSGVAIHKACTLIGRLKHMGATVRVIMTKNATELITSKHFGNLSGYPVAVDTFEDPPEYDVHHISLANWADVVLVVPATYNVINKVATGIADDMLTTTLAAVPKGTPVVFAPAMNTNMWVKPVLQRNIDQMKADGYYFIDPVSGMLACGVVGEGKMAESAAITEFISDI